MKAHGLNVTDDMIYYGTYWYDSGDYMVDELVKDMENLPEAIVCANDCMAIGVCTAFDKHGIRVPEDIAVVEETARFLLHLRIYRRRIADTTAWIT